MKINKTHCSIEISWCVLHPNFDPEISEVSLLV